MPDGACMRHLTAPRPLQETRTKSASVRRANQPSGLEGEVSLALRGPKGLRQPHTDTDAWAMAGIRRAGWVPELSRFHAMGAQAVQFRLRVQETKDRFLLALMRPIQTQS